MIANSWDMIRTPQEDIPTLSTSIFLHKSDGATYRSLNRRVPPSPYLPPSCRRLLNRSRRSKLHLEGYQVLREMHLFRARKTHGKASSRPLENFSELGFSYRALSQLRLPSHQLPISLLNCGSGGAGKSGENASEGELARKLDCDNLKRSLSISQRRSPLHLPQSQ